MKEAILWKPAEKKEVQCFLCYRMCRIKPDDKGYCRVRKNIDGKLYSLNYGKAIATSIDPIEKKPFYHFMPGTQSFSFSTVGCNFRCKFCQNWEISQEFGDIWGEDLPPEKIRELCKRYGVEGVAYTYTEPTIFMEYSLDTAKAVYDDGRYNVFVTNGYMTTAAINEMEKVIDASRIDLKGWYTDKVYEELSGDVNLDYVLNSIKELHKRQHIEIITLVIPGYNDSEDSLRGIAEWVYKLSPDIPMHFIGFYPAYKMPATPSTTLEKLRQARKMAMDVGLRYVYTGNRLDPETESTYCPNCGKAVVKRQGFSVVENRLTKDAKCSECGKKLNFVLDIEKYRKRKRFREQ